MTEENVISLEKFKTFATGLFQRAKLAAMVGKTFLGNRDLYAELGYKRTLEFSDYSERYVRGGIASKVVDAFASATWRNTPTILSENKKFIKDFETLAERIKLYHYLDRIDRLAGIGQYGVLLIGTRGAGDLSAPLAHVSSPDDILFLAPFTQGNADIITLEDSTSNSRFAMPKEYRLNMIRDTDNLVVKNFPTGQIKVHHSRILHVADGLTEDDIFGTPRMQKVWNYLDDLDKISGASAEGVWQTVNRGIQFDLDKDMDMDEDDEAAFSDEIAEYFHTQKKYFKTKGITANVLGSSIADPRGPFNVVISLISGTTGIPQRVLLGSERGELASSQDERNFNGRVKERQTTFATPLMIRPIIDTFIEIGALPKVEYKVFWPDPSTLTEKEMSDVAARTAQSVRNVSGQSQGEMVLPPRMFAEKFLRLTKDEMKEWDRLVKEDKLEKEKIREDTLNGRETSTSSGEDRGKNKPVAE